MFAGTATADTRVSNVSVTKGQTDTHTDSLTDRQTDRLTDYFED